MQNFAQYYKYHAISANAEGLTQQELAARCGMKAPNLSRIENGNGNPSVATLNKIAKGLNKKLEIRFV